MTPYSSGIPAGTNSSNGKKNVNANTHTHSQTARAHEFHNLPVGNTNSISANNGHQSTLKKSPVTASRECGNQWTRSSGRP